MHLYYCIIVCVFFFINQLDFKVLFPCSGLKEGIVDLKFDLQYTLEESGDKRVLKIHAKRHCNKNGMISL